MKVLYIHQYFNTPQQGGSLRSYYLARELVKRGHMVCMLTCHNENTRLVEWIEGIKVTYLPVRYSQEMSFMRRSIAFMGFMVLAMLESCRARKVDVCYVMSTPLSTGIVALFNKLVLRRPYIFEVGDLWPAVPVAMGLVRKAWLRSFLRLCERMIYKGARGLVGLSPPICQSLKTLAPNLPVETIFNIADCHHWQPVSKPGYVDGGEFVIAYTGAFGLANDLMQVVGWAEAVAEWPLKFILVGQGSEKAQIKAAVLEKGLKNVVLYDAMSKNELKKVIDASDAMLVSFAQVPLLHTGSPNKFFDALAAGKLVIANFGGWIRELITEEKCGFSALTAEEFKRQIKAYLDDPELLKTTQHHARQLAEQRFDLKIQASRQEDFLKRLVN